jgi:hypothetical protein
MLICVALLVVAILLFRWITNFLAEDDCLDHGGQWIPEPKGCVIPIKKPEKKSPAFFMIEL